jgi:tRNA-splicing ligase RtcB
MAMTDANYTFYKTDNAPLYLWDKGGAFEDSAMAQLHNVAALPFVYHHVAGMPDVHWGMGATIGSVIATQGAIVPAAVGVDIGCGMMAVQTTLRAEHLPDNLHAARLAIEKSVPHGRTDNGGKNDRGAWGAGNEPPEVVAVWRSLEDRYNKIVARHPKAKSFNNSRHLGSLGTGNHFIEVCLDEDDRVWVMLHSGSRGAGNRIGTYFIQAAKREMERWHIISYLPDRDLSYMVENTELFDDYMEAVGWAQDFALENRTIMMHASLNSLRGVLGDFALTDLAVNCHHNYVRKESHYGQNVWVTRKGAVRARKGDLGIIPGSMGTGSFIVEGLGNPNSFCSCSHGAGRTMSRTAAKKAITVDDHARAMEGIEARLDADVLDESPAAYKDIGKVMEAQKDLVRVKHRLRQVVNVKG